MWLLGQGMEKKQGTYLAARPEEQRARSGVPLAFPAARPTSCTMAPVPQELLPEQTNSFSGCQRDTAWMH